MAQFCLARAFDEAGLGAWVTVDSAGVTGWEAGRPMDPRAVTELLAHGFDAGAAKAFRAREFQAAWFADLDLVLALDYGHFRELRDRAAAPGDRDKVALLRSFDPATAGLCPKEQGIDDPWYGTQSDFESAYALIQAAVPGVVAYVRAALESASGTAGGSR